MILEEFVAGRELELALLGNEDVRVSRAGEIIASREFYDYDDKYVLGLAETVAPTDLKDTQLEQAQRLVTAAYRALRVEGLARIDVFLREDDEIVINEVNTMPGFTPISMFPMLWEAEGLPFEAVVESWCSWPGPATPVGVRCAPTGSSDRGTRPRRAAGRGGAGPGRAGVAGPDDQLAPEVMLGQARSLRWGTRHPCSATMGAGPAGAASTPSVPCGVW